MFNTEALIVVGLIAFFIGLVIGVVVGRLWVPGGQQKDLEQKLSSAQEELESYQHGVADHFVGTAKIVSELNSNYKELHEHLSKGALRLASAEVSGQILSSSQSIPFDEEKAGATVLTDELVPPKDYAPKTPGEHGVLSEKFALQEEKEEPGIEVRSASTNDTDADIENIDEKQQNA